MNTKKERGKIDWMIGAKGKKWRVHEGTVDRQTGKEQKSVMEFDGAGTTEY